jgi:hypothetical protein
VLLDGGKMLTSGNIINAVVVEMWITECFGNFAAKISADTAGAVNTDSFYIWKMIGHFMPAFVRI